jgi:hypothetical protein
MRTLRRVRKRQHRCYELALYVMHEESGAEKFTLVHGRIIVGAVWLGHAWIETGNGEVYDPVEDRYTPASEYSGVAEYRYSRQEAVKLFMHARRSKGPYLFGPWHSSDVKVEHLYDPTPAERAETAREFRRRLSRHNRSPAGRLTG